MKHLHRIERLALKRVGVGLTLGVLLAACSGGGRGVPDAAATTDAADAAGDATAGDTALGSSCQDIRVCVSQCQDTACADTCAARGTADAQALYQMLLTCTLQTCASAVDVDCSCREQCYADGYCLALRDQCVGAVTPDLVCDTVCGG